MAVLTTGHTFVDGQQVTSDRLNNIANAATFATAAVDGTTTQLSSGAIIVKDLGISTGKIDTSAVTTAKLATNSVSTAKIIDGNVTKAKIEDFTNLTVLGNVSGSAATPAEVTIIDDDTMGTASATTLATSESIKAYVDAQIGDNNDLSEVLANGNTTGANNIIVTAGQAITTDTVSETTADTGVTVDSLLIKDGGITAAGTSTFAGQTISDLGTVTTANIDGGSIDGTTVGASSASTGAFTTLSTTGDFNADSGTLFVDASANRVGIGTTSPGHTLDVSGEFRVNGGGSGTILVNDEDSSLCPTMTFLRNGGGTELQDFIKFENSGGEVGSINSSGGAYFLNNVGIGTASPSKTLHVVNTTSSGAHIQYDGRSNTEFGLRIESNVSGGNFEGDFANNGSLLDLFANSSVTSGGDILACRTQSSAPVMLVKGNGNVGIGDATPSYKLDVNGTGHFVNDLTLDEDLIHNLGGDGALPGYSADGTSSHGTRGCVIQDGGVNGSTIYVARRNSWALHLASDTGSQGSPATVVRFADMDEQGSDGAGQVGSITITPSATAYNTSSDYRLKENNVAITDGIDRLKQLSPYRFNFKRDADTTVDGFFAHEVSDVVPEAITGTKDGMRDQEYEVSPAVYEDVVHPAIEATYDENGNELTPAAEEWTESVLVTEAVRDTRSVPDYQGIDQSKLVPLLTAALQEAVAKIEALEARVQTLEG
jgi:hypothetical protein